MDGAGGWCNIWLMSVTMADLDAMPAAGFLAAMGDVFEHSPWVMEAVVGMRPFGTVRRLHEAAMGVVREAGVAAQEALLRAHPELGGVDATGGLTRESGSEQRRLGFDSMGEGERAALVGLNAAYRARFGYPAIVALARHARRESVMEAIRMRLGAENGVERARSLDEVGHVTRARLEAWSGGCLRGV